MATFRRYSFDQIRQIADQVRAQHTPNPDGIPVDVERIIEQRLKIQIEPVNDIKSDQYMEAMLSNDLKRIQIDAYSFNNPNFDNRTRFSLAHELGHYFLHQAFYEQVKFQTVDEWIQLINSIDANEYEWYEKHADEFAGRLLVPLKALLAEIEKQKEFLKAKEQEAVGLGVTDKEELAKWKRSSVANRICKKFGVSAQTIEIRIWREKILI